MTDVASTPPPKKLSADWLRSRVQKAGDREAEGILVRHDAEGRYEPFAMTDMQQAYWLGRDRNLPGGGSMQMYLEFEGALLDLPRLERAWNRLIARHDMLRAVANPDGTQRVLKDVPRQHVELVALEDSAERAQEAALLELRARMLAEAPPLDSWPQSRLAYASLDGNAPGKGRLFMRLDMWCFDGRSFQIIIEDLAALYRSPEAALPETEVCFRDYVETLGRFERTPAFEKSLAWWRRRLESLPPPPALPYARGGVAPGGSGFRRLDLTLTAEETAALKWLAQHYDLGLPAVMASAYAQALSRWSGQTHFTLNVPRFNRPDWHPDFIDIVGEFATFGLLEVSLDPTASFRDAARRLQGQLWSDLSHSEVSGVRLLRELARQRGTMEIAAMPVVFTTMPERRSADAEALEQAIGAFGGIAFSIGGTPQVWLDNQYFELGGELYCVWDAIGELFPEGLLEDMFESYAALLKSLVAGKEGWEAPLRTALPKRQQETRDSVNDLPWTVPESSLIELIAGHAAEDPEAFGVLDGAGVTTRGGLSRAAGALAGSLKARGIGPGDAVAVYLPRGAGLVEAALGIWGAGAIYVPLDVDSPKARLDAILENIRPKAVLSAFGPEGTPGAAEARIDLAEVVAGAGPEDRLPAFRPDPESLAAIIHTSGSTGVPKGVMLPWSALSHVVHYTNARFGLGPEDRAVMMTSCHHDLSLFDLLGPLAAGGGLIALDSERALDPAHWLRRAEEGRATFWNSVPRFAEALVRHLEENPGATRPPMRRFVLGGDFVPSNLPARLFAQWQGLAVTTIGGPTETTIWNIMNDVAPDYRAEERLPYGKAIPGCSYRILDEAGRDCPDWVLGEMVCGGASLTEGYLNLPEETAQRFITAADSGERLYRTGDRGRYLPDGRIEILGRVDSQLNVGGYRTDPAEIETVIERHPDVATAVAVARKDGGADRLCAFVTLAEGRTFDEKSVVEHAARHLPAALLPKAWQPLEAMPLTANGKVDRAALRDLEIAQGKAESVTPDTPIERCLSELWSEALGQESAGVTSNFFGEGGDSIGATRILNRIEQRLGLRLSIGAFFKAPTVRGLAAEYHDALAARCGKTAQEMEGLPLDRLLALAGGRDGEAEAFPEADRDNPPLSWSQERLWFLDRLEAGKPIYIMPFCTAIEGPLSVAALEAALHDVAQRHEPLRSVYPAVDSGGGGEARLRILERAEVPFRFEDLSSLSGRAQDKAWRKIVEDESAKPFDLTCEPSFRVCLAALGPERHALCCTFHHIAFDGWSIGVFNRDLFAAYGRRVKGEAPAWKATASYADFALWQRNRLSEEALEGEESWWRDRLSDFAALSPSGDFIPPAERSFAGASLTFDLPAPLMAEVEAFAKRCDATANIVLLAAFAVALGRFEQQSRFVIGASTAGRDHPATEDMVGFFVKNLPVRVSLEENLSLRRFVAQMRDEFLEGLDHLELPFQGLVTAIAPDRDPNRNPIYQVAFTYENAPQEDARLAGLALSALPAEVAASHLDLDVLVWPAAEGARCSVVYSRDIFRPQTVENLWSAFYDFLEAGLANPDAAILSMPLAPEQALAASSCFSGGEALGQSVCLWSCLSGSLSGLGVALEGEDGSGLASGPELLARAGDFDAALTSGGHAPGAPVALLLDPGVDYACAILACLRRGSPYALLDPLLPAPALGERLASAGIGALVAARERLAALLAELPSDLEVLGIAPEDLEGRASEVPAPRPGEGAAAAVAMVWTSGSTGTPKAPVLTQGAVLNRLHWDRESFAREGSPKGLLKTSPAFVDSVAEILQPLFDGYPAVVPDADAARAPSALLGLMRDCGVSRLVLTPSVLRAVLDVEAEAGVGAGLWPLKRLHVSGEPLPADLLPRLAERLSADCVVLNIYGSAEVTADVTAARLALSAAPGRVPIGAPLPGCEIWLLDGRRRPVAPGAVGEMHVAGVGLAQGYHGAPELSARRFFAWTAPDGRELRLYATGDLARRGAEGDLVVLGRKDGQIKLRGVRIEPGEIEARLLDLPEVRAAVVSAVRPEPGSEARRLVAYLEPAATVPDENRRADHWQRIYDQSYQDVSAGGDVLEDFRIWRSAIDGAPIPASEMQAWVQANLDLVRERAGRSLVEIGCGQGLLLGRLGADFESYLGTDISAEALVCVRQLQARRAGLEHVRCLQLAADQRLPDELCPEGGFDVALLSSVVQYLPSADYLLRSLEVLLPRMAEGGRILVTDLRSLPLAPLLATEILLHRAEAGLDRPALQRRLQQQQAQEPELLVDPRYFLTLKGRLPRLAGIEARPKPGRADNELNSYRYDVVLHLDRLPPETVAVTQWHDWEGPEALRACLAQRPARFALRGLPHRRLRRPSLARALLASEEIEDAAAWRARLAGAAGEPDARAEGLDPAALRALAASAGYRALVRLGLESDPTSFAVLFQPEDAGPATLALPPRQDPEPKGQWIGRPYDAAAQGDLATRARDHLRRTLTPAQIPEHFITLHDWPKSPSQKIIKHKLPLPEVRPGGKLQQPKTEGERLVAEVWAEVLGGPRDLDASFFEVGGSSLLLAEAHQRLVRRLGRRFPLVELFRHPSIRSQAAYLQAEGTEGPSAAAEGRQRALKRKRRRVKA